MQVLERGFMTREISQRLRDFLDKKKFLLAFLLIMVSGCSCLYFRPAGPPPPLSPQYALEEWPYKEYWTGLVFNGRKIGFSHLAIQPAEEGVQLYEIRAEAVFLIRLLGASKKVILKSYDQVRDDLTLVRFSYEYSIHDHNLGLRGEVSEGCLEVSISTGHDTKRQVIQVAEKLYPTSTISLYPVLHGLKLGERYAYLVYDGQTQQITRVTQRIGAYQKSELFPGKAYKVITTMLGQKTTTWFNHRGKPVLEMSMGGVLFSTLESQKMAKRYLLSAALNKEETLLDYSLVKVDTPIPNPRNVTFLRIALKGEDKTPQIPTGKRQRCYPQHGEIICEIHAIDPYQLPENHRGPASEEMLAPYLRASLTIESKDVRIREAAQQIVGPTKRRFTQISKIVEWIQKNISKEPVDVFSALDVLIGKKAECQGHALLYTALARALSIPSRVVNGLVYSAERQGFLYHSWAESYVAGTWIPVDPVFDTLIVDATHIKLLEGETPADCLPLIDMVGKLKSRILSFTHP